MSFSGAWAPPSRTCAQVGTYVKRQFGDESGVQIQDSDIINWVNQAQDEINNANRVLTTYFETPTVPGQAEYDFPDDSILEVDSLAIDGRVLPNVPFNTAQDRLAGMDPKLEFQGRPQFWYAWGGKLTIWPIPQSADHTIRIYAVRRPVLITATDQVLDLPDKYFSAICQFVMTQAYEMDENFPAAQQKSSQYHEETMRLIDEERQAQNQTYPVIQVQEGEGLGYYWW